MESLAPNYTDFGVHLFTTHRDDLLLVFSVITLPLIENKNMFEEEEVGIYDLMIWPSKYVLNFYMDQYVPNVTFWGQKI